MAALTCPHCGVRTAFNPAWIKGQGVLVDYSSSDKTHKGEVAISAVVEDYRLTPHFAIVQCVGCERLFAASKEYETSGDWVTVWPLVTRSVSNDIPENISMSFQDALLCRAVKALGGCLMMCRTALIRLLRDQRASNLKGLRDSGKISDMLYQQADEVRLWANAIGHEDFAQDSLTPEVCDELVDYVESLLDAVYVQPSRLAKHRELRKEART